MSRKLKIPHFQIFDNEDITTNPIGKETVCDSLDRVFYNISWSSADILGQLYVEVNHDLNEPWTELDFGQPLVVDTTEIGHQILVEKLTAKYIRIRYAHTSGTGTISASIDGVTQGA